MILVIGGAYAGKRAYADRQYPNISLADGAACEKAALYTCAGMDHFHEYIRRFLSSDRDGAALVAELTRRNPDVLLISDEIGYGIVPDRKELRDYRELTGRILTKLAAQADTVIRVVCGIGTVIKG